LPLLLGAFQGEQRFLTFSVLSAGQAALKLVAAIAMGKIWGALGIIAGISLATGVVYLMAFVMLRSRRSINTRTAWWRPAARYLAVVVPSTLALGLLLSADVLLVKHYFPTRIAGEYAAVAAMGRAIFWGATGVATVLFPKIIHRGVQGHRGTHLVAASLALVAFGGVLGLILLSASSVQLLSAFAGSAYVEAAVYLPWYAIGMTLLGGVAVLIAVLQSRGDAKFLGVLLPLALFEPALIVVLHSSVIQVIQEVDIATALILTALVCVYIYQERHQRPTAGVASSNGHSAGVLGTTAAVKAPISTGLGFDAVGEVRLRILILSWRCPRHPKAGGAEKFTHEIAARLVAQGHSIEWFATSFAGASAEDDIDGIRVRRAGSWWSVYWHAYMRYRGSTRERFDVVIDEVNAVPFLAHLWSGLPTYLLVFQLHRAVWWYQAPVLLALIGFLTEPLFLRACRRQPAITISASTKNDLRRLGFVAPITVLPIGLERVVVPDVGKASSATFLYVGRLVPAKRIDHMLVAFARYRQTTGRGQFWLVGTGDDRYVNLLCRLAKRLKIQDSIRFWGHVTPSEKHRLMAEAHVLVMASVREGWGLVITEANACGTPAIVYDVPGLRDAVRHEGTGLVVRPNPKSLSDAMIRLTGESELYERLATAARSWGASFSFDETARAITSAFEGKSQGPIAP
jgi:glycosyltransferase involved in cell wall biosynthesis